MPTFQDFPCPSCHAALPLDPAKSGTETFCPHCEALIMVPEVVAPVPAHKVRKGKSAVKPSGRGSAVPEAVKVPSAEEMEAELILENTQKNFPLHKTQDLLPAEPALEPEDRAILPPTRSKSSEEENRRLAAMAAGSTYEHTKFEKKGMISFGCPRCNRPLWVSKKDTGIKLKCEGCGSSITSPRPEMGLPAQCDDVDAATPSFQLPKAVIPTSRQVEDVALEEGRAGGRAKRHTPLPGLTATDSPVRMQPVPAKPDESFNGQSLMLPSERGSQARTLGPRTVEPSPAGTPLTEGNRADQVVAPIEPKRDKGSIRLNNKRRNFSPQKQLENDPEIVDSWGPVESKPQTSKRFVVIGWLCMIPILLGLAIWGIREVFRKKEPISSGRSEEGVDATHAFYVARGVLNKFYSAASIEEMSRYVRHPERTLPRMRDYYKRTPPNQTVEKLEDPMEARVDDINFISALLTLEGKSRQLVSLEIPSVDTDDLRIDWESLVHWSEVPWDEFMRQEMTDGHDFRVVMQIDEYPAEPFEDKKRWVCFKLYNPGNVGKDYGFCFGYVEVNSPTAISMILPLRRASEGGQVTFNAILALRFTPESRGRKNQVPQVIIDKFTDGWILPND